MYQTSLSMLIRRTEKRPMLPVTSVRASRENRKG